MSFEGQTSSNAAVIHYYQDNSQLASARSGIKPLKLVVLGKNGPVLLVPVSLLSLLGMDAVQLGGLLADEEADVDIRRARIR